MAPAVDERDNLINESAIMTNKLKSKLRTSNIKFFSGEAPIGNELKKRCNLSLFKKAMTTV